MASFLAVASERATASIVLLALLPALGFYVIWTIVYRLYLDPLSQYPGPRAAALTRWWRTYKDCVQQWSYLHEVEKLHHIYGAIVRTGPNELHFASPAAFHDIYNHKNRWNKEPTVYQSLGEDHSSFGYLEYSKAKERRDVLSRTFSPQTIEGVGQKIVRDKARQTVALCEALKRQSEAGKPADLFLAFRCATMDVITYLCFGEDIDAANEPDFQSPLIMAMSDGAPIIIYFKHFPLFRKLISSIPPEQAIKSNPQIAGMIRMQQLLRKRIAARIDDPETLKELPHSTTIYHLLINPDAHKSKTAGDAEGIYEESQALMFGGGDTTANTMMVGTFYLLKNPPFLARLKKELVDAWPKLEKEPTLKDLEGLPYLNAVIKESLRIGPNIPAGLPRIVPAGGAVIDGHPVPAGTIVSMGTWFLHQNETVFEEPLTFKPDRWLNPSAKNLERHLVPFSKGPRMCLGLNLAWCELRIVFAHVFRKFDLESVAPDPSPDHLPWRDIFSPAFEKPHLAVKMQPVNT